MFDFGAYLTASKERSCPSSARARFHLACTIIWVLPKKGQSPANSSHEAEPRASGGLRNPLLRQAPKRYSQWYNMTVLTRNEVVRQQPDGFTRSLKLQQELNYYAKRKKGTGVN